MNFIQSAINHIMIRHSCQSRNPGKYWIPRQARNDKKGNPASPRYESIPTSPSRGEGCVGCRGFTLIEIIIVTVILAIASAITIKFLADGFRVYTMTVYQKTLLDEGKFALERMCRDIRDAQSISVPNTGSSGSSITFVRTNATAYDGVGDAITFQVPVTTLIKSKSPSYPGGVTPALAEHVTGFTVTRGQSTTNNLNEITLTLNLLLTSGENVTLQTKIYPKNLPKDAIYKNFCQNWMEAISN